jgi:hypothetical protein
MHQFWGFVHVFSLYKLQTQLVLSFHTASCFTIVSVMVLDPS